MISGKGVLREICMRQSLMTAAIRHSRKKEKAKCALDKIIVPDVVTLELFYGSFSILGE